MRSGVITPQLLRIVEPQMTNFFHAPFNAAFLHTIALGYPAAKLIFQAHPAHLAAVLQVIQESAPEIEQRVSWEPLPNVLQGSVARRLLKTRGLLASLLSHNEPLIFCSISRLQLLTLKWLMRRGDLARCVLHGDLESVVETESFPKSLLTLRRALESHQPPGLRYLLLSESIAENLPAALRDGMGEVGVLDHPYHFPVTEGVPRRLQDGLVIGIFGNTGDARLLEHVARAVLAKAGQVRFRLVGFVQDEETVQRIGDVVECTTAIPISRPKFQHSAGGLTHALWLAEPGGFRLRASGTLFDALAYSKPLIYTANDYLDRYRLAEAGFGVRCESIDDVANAVTRIAQGAASPKAQVGYEAQIASLQMFRERFTPEALAKNVGAALRI